MVTPASVLNVTATLGPFGLAFPFGVPTEEDRLGRRDSDSSATSWTTGGAAEVAGEAAWTATRAGGARL